MIDNWFAFFSLNDAKFTNFYTLDQSKKAESVHFLTSNTLLFVYADSIYFSNIGKVAKDFMTKLLLKLKRPMRELYRILEEPNYAHFVMRDDERVLIMTLSVVGKLMKVKEIIRRKYPMDILFNG